MYKYVIIIYMYMYWRQVYIMFRYYFTTRGKKKFKNNNK